MSRRIRYRALGVAAAAAALVLATTTPAFSAPTSSNDDDDRRTSDEILNVTVNDELIATLDALTAVGVIGPKAEMGSLVAETKLTASGDLEVLYFDGGTELSEKLKETLAQLAPTPLDVVSVPVTFDPEAVEELARQISENGHPSLAALGVTEINSVEVNNETGEITVFSNDLASKSVSDAQLPFSVATGGEVDFQTRQTDSAPFSGGASISYSAGTWYTDCTAGFNWKKWNTNELMGSTAEHCYAGTGASWWLFGIKGVARV